MKKDENGQLVTTTTKSCTKKATLFLKKHAKRGFERCMQNVPI